MALKAKKKGHIYLLTRKSNLNLNFPKLVFKTKWKRGWGNGYVLLPEDHPCYGLDYDSIERRFFIDVHGGLTFSANLNDCLCLICKNKSLAKRLVDKLGNYWVIGFDTGHGYENPEEWNENGVLRETERLRKQMIKLYNGK